MLANVDVILELTATGRMNVLPCNVIHLEVIGKNIVWVLPNLIKGHLPYLSGVVSAQL